MSVMTCTSFGLGLSPHNSAFAQELSRQQPDLEGMNFGKAMCRRRH